MINLVAGIKNHNCSESDSFPATDTYLFFQSVNSYRSESDMMVERICQHCGNLFNIRPSYIKLGRGIYCSRSCQERSPKWLQKISEAHRGCYPSEETRKKMGEARRGDKNHMWGKRPSEEVRQKLREAHRGEKNPNYGKPRSDIIRKRIREAQAGEKSPHWIDGRSFEPYCYKFNRGLKERIRERDNYTCQLCGVKENGRRHHVHHIHYDKKNCNPDLITLCIRCNSKVNVNRDYYEELFMNKLKAAGHL